MSKNNGPFYFFNYYYNCFSLCICLFYRHVILLFLLCVLGYYGLFFWVYLNCLLKLFNKFIFIVCYCFLFLHLNHPLSLILEGAWRGFNHAPPCAFPKGVTCGTYLFRFGYIGWKSGRKFRSRIRMDGSAVCTWDTTPRTKMGRKCGSAFLLD